MFNADNAKAQRDEPQPKNEPRMTRMDTDKGISIRAIRAIRGKNLLVTA